MYRIKKIFQSIQGEGELVGTWCWFIRFAGCNRNCLFCDTDHKPSNKDLKLTAEEIDTFLKNNDEHENTKWIVLTGGEPILTIDKPLLERLKKNYKLALETNGTMPLGELLDYFDHITMSPKVPSDQIKLEKCHSLKILYPFPVETGMIDQRMDPVQWKDYPADFKFIQPLDVPTIPKKDMAEIAITKLSQLGGDWRLSVQLHKFLGVE